MTSEMLLADKYLHIINQRGQVRKQLKRIYHNMRQEGLFFRAYTKLYANRGATSIGSDENDTIQGMSRQRIAQIIQQLANGTYRWRPSRRSNIPKADGQKRTIAIPNWTDKLVQEVMRMILEAYYEPRFAPSSHGFRPHRGCHTALVTIRQEWRGTKWFIEGDIKGCFDNINHKLLIQIISQDIKDNRFIKLLKGMLKAGYLDDWQYHKTHSGTPQGGVLSPLLANIYLHQLDQYVETVLQPAYNRGKKRTLNKRYYALSDKIQQAKAKKDWQLYRQLEQKRRQMPAIETHDDGYRRLRYIRYADDLLLGFTGPKVEAETIKAELTRFLQTMALTLTANKTKITHAQSEKARFLGYHISTTKADCKLIKDKLGVKSRRLNGAIRLEVPPDVVQKWVRKYSRRGKPIHQPQHLYLNEYEMVASFGAQLRGITQYYLLAADVARKIGRVRWCVMEALRKTLRNKYKCSRKQSYTRYKQKPTNPNEWTHYRVTIERDNRPPLIAKCGELPLRPHKDIYLRDTHPAYVIRSDSSELIKRLVQETCELCGKNSPLQAHHINKLAHLRRRWQGRKRKPKWVETMIARHRKTILVCYSCHQQITHGRYDGKRVG